MNKLIKLTQRSFSKLNVDQGKTFYNDIQTSLRKKDYVSLKHHLQNYSNPKNEVFKQIFGIQEELEHNDRIFKQMEGYEFVDRYLSLEWIGQVQRNLFKPIINLQLYQTQLNTYFQQLRSQTRVKDHLINNFCFIDNPQMRNLIKKNQLELIQLLEKTRSVERYQFQSIVKPQLFNITDMPMIYELFYQVYFPGLINISDLKEMNQVLIYLSPFSKIPFFLPKKVRELVEDILSKDRQIQFYKFTQIFNIIYLMCFKFPATLKQTEESYAFEQLHRKLFDMTIISQQKNKTVKIRLNSSQNILKDIESLSMNELAQSFQHRKEIFNNHKQTLSLAINPKYQTFNDKGSCLNIVLRRELEVVTQILRDQAKELYSRSSLQIKIKQARIVLFTSSMPTYQSSILYNYFTNHHNYQLFKNNICIPGFQKDLYIAAARIDAKRDYRSPNMVNFMLLMDYIKNKIDSKIQTEIKQTAQTIINNQEPSSKLEIVYSQEFESSLWSSNKIQKVLSFQSNYQTSCKNIALMLKNDPQYLIGLMKWNCLDYLTHYYIPNSLQIGKVKIQPCHYSEGIGYKATLPNADISHPHAYFRFNSELTKNLIFYGQTSINSKTFLLPGNLKSMMTELDNCSKKN